MHADKKSVQIRQIRLIRGLFLVDLRVNRIGEIMEIKDSVVLITGGAIRLGRAHGLHLARKGCLLYTSDAADDDLV